MTAVSTPSRDPRKSTRDELDRKDRQLRVIEAVKRRLEKDAKELRAEIAMRDW